MAKQPVVSLILVKPVIVIRQKIHRKMTKLLTGCCV